MEKKPTRKRRQKRAMRVALDEIDETPGAEINELLENFRKELENQGRSPRTVECYLSTVNRFLRRVRKTEGFTRDDVSGFLTTLKESGISNRSRAAYACGLRSYFRFMDNPELASKVPVPRYKFNLPKHLSKSEVAKIIEAAQNAQERAAFCLGYYCALRRSEVCAVKLGDIVVNSPSSRFLQVHGKGGYEDSVPIPDEAWEALQAMLHPQKTEGQAAGGIEDQGVQALKGGSGFLFQTSDGQMSPSTLGRLFKAAAKRAEVEDCSFHSLRHSRATHLLLDGLDLAFVNKLLRHRRLDTTGIYLHLVPRQLEKALAKIRELEGEAEADDQAAETQESKMEADQAEAEPNGEEGDEP